MHLELGDINKKRSADGDIPQETRPVKRQFPEILPLFSDVEAVYKSSRAALIEPTSISQKELRSVASFGDENGGLEYEMIHTKNGVVFTSGARGKVDPFGASKYETDKRLVPRTFPLSLFMRPKLNQEFQIASAQFRDAREQLLPEAEWVAHWHPRGSAKEHGGVSIEDFFVAAEYPNIIHFMMDEAAIYAYSANGQSQDTIHHMKRLSSHYYSELRKDKPYKSDEALALKAKEVYEDDLLRKIGTLCVKIPWGTPRAAEIVGMMSGKKKWDEIKIDIFTPAT